MKFLGTGAAESLPNPMCDCAVCTAVRAAGHHDYKKRSCFFVNDSTIIDFGTDVVAAAHEYELNLCGLQHILFTHSHDDHFSFANLSLLGMSSRVWQEPIHLYLSPQAFAWLAQNLSAMNPDFAVELLDAQTGYIRFGNGNAYLVHSVPCGEWFSVGELRVMAVKSTHQGWGKDELAWNYLLVFPNGKTLLYACDTGRYDAAALNAVKDRRLDALIMECTFGSRRMEKGCGHLDAYAFVDMLEQFLQQNTITTDTQVFSTHLNHKHTFSPRQLQAFFDENAPLPVQVAFDGQEFFLEERK
ncbi:MAG: MBL fold metallo-hydrolase [Ruthenibacterium sp.]